MLNKRYHYNKQVAVCEEDLDFLRKLKLEKFPKKSVAGTLSYIIDFFKSKKQKKLF